MAASESTKMPKLNGSHLEFEQEMKSNRFILFYYESALSYKQNEVLHDYMDTKLTSVQLI